MALEFLTQDVNIAESYPLDFIPPANTEKNSSLAPIIVDWEPMIKKILQDMTQKIPLPVISTKFHNALAEAAVQVARSVGEKRVVLSGGCFQNRYLTEQTVARLTEEGFQAYWHQRIPPNDGGISLGQAMAVL